MTIQQLKKELKITNLDIAKMFGYKNLMSYANSSAKKRIEKGLIEFYNTINQKQ